MPRRADAHIHLFEHSLPGSFPTRPGVQIDEAACYDSLAKEHDVAAALIICFTGYGNDGNNEYVAGLRRQYDWVRPAAFVDPGDPPSPATLDKWLEQGVAGLVMYIDPENAGRLRTFPDEVWEWMTARNWLLSVNSKGESWSAWHEVLDRHPRLRLVMSHLGLPDKVASPIGPEQARSGLCHQTGLARYPEVRVKLSGFYALTEPQHDYPHELAWPYVEVLIEEFGVERLLWASDFCPHLDFQTFSQTLGLLWKMPFLGDGDRDRIAGENLLELLASG